MRGILIYSRLDSKRLPRKALKKLGHQKVIDHVIEACNQVDNTTTIIATTDREVDAPLVDIADKHNVAIYRGSFEDIAQRTIGCINAFNLSSFVRINADSPFVNIPLINQGIELFDKSKCNFITNLIPRTYPYGISCEILDSKMFKENYKFFTDNDKEHITSYFYRNLQKFQVEKLPQLSPDSSQLSLVIDTIEDYTRISHFIKNKKDNLNRLTIPELIKTLND